MITDWDDAYSNGEYIENSAAYPDQWAKLAANFRDEMVAAKRAELDLAYGSAPRQKLDIFLPETTPKGLAVFVHGGYWKAFDKSYWSHLAGGAVSNGWVTCVPSYTLAPDARISDITHEIANAISFLARRIDGPIRLAGHSAGGHLVSRMLCANDPLTDEIGTRIEHTVSISGLHDLRPLMNAKMNDTLKIDANESVIESTALRRPRQGASITCWVGSDERPEFVRQSDLLANIWTGLGAKTDFVLAEGRHHFDVIAELSDPDGPLTKCFAN